MRNAKVRYRNLVADSARFDGFAFREGDIIISTPPKCGTTWTQTICALLIFGSPDFPQAVDLISPWLEQSLRPIADVVADLGAQKHRRFIKSHTPLDGLPFDKRVTYLCVGRDPRDVALSWDNHMDNMDIQALLSLRDKAVGSEDLPELLQRQMAGMQMPETESERFWHWVENDLAVTDSVGGLAFTLHHLGSFYAERDRPNVVMLHYGDLKADLEGQMRSLADKLGIGVKEETWPTLVPAATFESMKARAANVAPNATESIWRDQERFFNRGSSGQWHHVITNDADASRYRKRVEQLANDDLSKWVHQGAI